ncbi:MAG: hypothetical protein QMD88_07815 [Coprothermobacterota bacterium]|nr:hypothetical protein [Coprothermobacterota bacterium]
MSGARYNPPGEEDLSEAQGEWSSREKAGIAASHKLLLSAHAIYKKECLTILPTQEKVDMKYSI